MIYLYCLPRLASYRTLFLCRSLCIFASSFSSFSFFSSSFKSLPLSLPFIVSVSPLSGQVHPVRLTVNHDLSVLLATFGFVSNSLSLQVHLCIIIFFFLFFFIVFTSFSPIYSICISSFRSSSPSASDCQSRLFLRPFANCHLSDRCPSLFTATCYSGFNRPASFLRFFVRTTLKGRNLNSLF